LSSLSKKAQFGDCSRKWDQVLSTIAARVAGCRKAKLGLSQATQHFHKKLPPDDESRSYSVVPRNRGQMPGARRFGGFVLSMAARQADWRAHSAYVCLFCNFTLADGC